MMPVNSNMAPSPQPVTANDSIKQKEEMTQDCSITLLLSPTKTTVFQRATTSLGLIPHRVQEQKNYPVKSTDQTLIIHGPRRGHRCLFKIFLKIFIKISSIYDAIHNKPLLQSNVLLRILVKDFYLKILVHGNFISCVSNISTKISSKISCRQATPNHPYKFRLNSDDPCPPCAPWINIR